MTQADIQKLLEKSDRPLDSKEIAHTLGINRDSVLKNLLKMRNSGCVKYKEVPLGGSSKRIKYIYFS